MNVPSFEERRALNIFWNAAGDHSLKPELRVFEEDGRADLYRNFIIGAAYRYYDYQKLESFFRYLKRDLHSDFYEKLTWLGMEACVYRRAVRERRALEPLRRAYAEQTAAQGEAAAAVYFLDELRIAHFRRVLGLDPGLAKPALNLLNELEFDEALNTDQIIAGMREIIRVYFDFHRAFKMFLWRGKNDAGDIKPGHVRSLTVKKLQQRGKKGDLSGSGGAGTGGRESLGAVFLRLTEEQEQRRREYMERASAVPFPVRSRRRRWRTACAAATIGNVTFSSPGATRTAFCRSACRWRKRSMRRISGISRKISPGTARPPRGWPSAS